MVILGIVFLFLMFVLGIMFLMALGAMSSKDDDQDKS